MRVVLMSPKGPLYRHGGGIFGRNLRAAPLTLTTLASLVPEDLDVDLRLVDEGIEAVPDRIDADLVGMTVITGSAPRAYELAARYRAQGAQVVLGGPHVTLIPDDARPHADCIVTGYAEETWPELLRDFSVGRMRSRYDMADDFSFERLPGLPFPRRDLLKRRAYSTRHTFEATRGCIHRCDFCVVPSAWGNSPYRKPVAHVVEDIRRTGARRILFYDLNLISDHAYARELFSALVPLRVRWFGLATALLGRDPELLELLHRSGCRGLLIGFESLSAEGLAACNKRFHQVGEYGELMKRLHELGIAVNGTFVFGTDADTPETFEITRQFVIEHRVDLPRFSILTPFPGTPLFRRLDAEGRIMTRDWSLYDGQHVVFQPRHMTEADLLAGHEEVWRSVYGLGPIVSRCRAALRDRLLLFGVNLGYRFYARHLSRFYTCTGGVA
jgi:radical SAM superfamily enzyme YgiQ (UPF0313 family)